MDARDRSQISKSENQYPKQKNSNPNYEFLNPKQACLEFRVLFRISDFEFEICGFVSASFAALRGINKLVCVLHFGLFEFLSDSEFRVLSVFICSPAIQVVQETVQLKSDIKKLKSEAGANKKRAE